MNEKSKELSERILNLKKKLTETMTFLFLSRISWTY